MPNLDNILKSRDITLPTKLHLVKAMFFPVVMYGCESWTIKKAECWRIDAFELWYWRRLLRVLWTTRRSNQSIINEISPDYSLEGLMLKLKLQYFGHLMQRTDSLERPWCWERLKAGGEGYNRGWDVWMASPTQQTSVWASITGWWWTGKPGMLQSMGSCRKESDMTEQLNWIAKRDHDRNSSDHQTFPAFPRPFAAKWQTRANGLPRWISESSWPPSRSLFLLHDNHGGNAVKWKCHMLK